MRTHEILDLVSSTFPDRPLLTDGDGTVTAQQLSGDARRLASLAIEHQVDNLVFVGQNSRALQIGLFAASIAGVPFVPLNYRLTDDRLQATVQRTLPGLAIVDRSMVGRLGDTDGLVVVETEGLAERLATLAPLDPVGSATDDGGDGTAVLLFTSGTTGDPKAAMLAHDNLTSYVLNTVEFAGAGEDEAALVAVPPYHIAGVSSVLSAAFAGRRSVYLRAFEPAEWVQTVHEAGVTQAMVVPTMMDRILRHLDTVDHGLPALRSLAYGGGPMPRPVIERALQTLPHVAFVNAYGLTETASTISILGPDDHREALVSNDPAVARRLASVGQPLPTVELSIRDQDGRALGPGERGEVWVRGDQVSGEYVGIAGATDGWFRTRDSAEVDEHGYLYLHGRLDDVIVRGGENLSPGEIEAVLVEHRSVRACAVVGLPHNEWGECVAAAVVRADDAVGINEEVLTQQLQTHVRSQLRSTQTPETVTYVTELPSNETGKILRRVLREQLQTQRQS